MALEAEIQAGEIEIIPLCMQVLHALFYEVKISNFSLTFIIKRFTIN